jgi:hypothetical protein
MQRNTITTPKDKNVMHGSREFYINIFKRYLWLINCVVTHFIATLQQLREHNYVASLAANPACFCSSCMR